MNGTPHTPDFARLNAALIGLDQAAAELRLALREVGPEVAQQAALQQQGYAATTGVQPTAPSAQSVPSPPLPAEYAAFAPPGRQAVPAATATQPAAAASDGGYTDPGMPAVPDAGPGTAATPPQPQEPQQPWYQREHTVRRILAIAGGAITLAGAGFLIAVAIVAGLLGPMARVVLAYLIAGAFVGVGGWLFQKDRTNPGSQALITTGVLISVGTTISLHALLGWVPAGVAGIGAFLFAAAGLAWARYCQAIRPLMTLSVLSLLIVLPVGVTFFSYTSDFFGSITLLLVGAAALAASLGLAKDSPAVVGTGTFVVGAILSGIALALTPVTGMPIIAYLVLVPVVICGLLAALGRYGLTETAGRDTLAAAAVALTAIPGAWGVDGRQEFLPWSLLGAAVLILATALWLRRQADRPAVAIHTTVGVCAMLVGVVGSYYFDVEAASHALNSALLAAGIAVALLLWSLRDDHLIPRLGLAIFTATAAAYSLSLIAGVWTRDIYAIIGWRQIILALVLTGLVAALWIREAPRLTLSVRAMVLLGLATLVLAAVPVVTVLTSLGAQLDDIGSTTQAMLLYYVGHAIVSISWIVAAALALQDKLPLPTDGARLVGLVLALAGIGKLVFFDLTMLDGLVRVMAFLFSGVILLVIASLRKSSDTSGDDDIPPIPPVPPQRYAA